MAKIYGTSTSSFPSDAYGVDTDLPSSAYEKLNVLNRQCVDAIRSGFDEWIKETAREYFDTSDWTEDFWAAWREIIWETI